jgi:hypothetical protein
MEVKDFTTHTGGVENKKRKKCSIEMKKTWSVVVE